MNTDDRRTAEPLPHIDSTGRAWHGPHGRDACATAPEPVVLLRARDASRIVRPCRDCGRVTADLALVNLEGQRDAATAWWLPYCADAPAEPTAWLPRRAQWWRLPVLGDWNTTSHECGRGACWINHAGELVGP